METKKTATVYADATEIAYVWAISCSEHDNDLTDTGDIPGLALEAHGERNVVVELNAMVPALIAANLSICPIDPNIELLPVTIVYRDHRRHEIKRDHIVVDLR